MTQAPASPKSVSLAPDCDYEQDYMAWLFHIAVLLEQQQWSQIDAPNLIEELKDMGKRERRAIPSHLEIVLMHLLKYRYQPQKRSNSWRYTLFEHRDRIAKQLADSPSLKAHLTAHWASSYTTARRKATLKTGLNIRQFPESAPFTLEQTLDLDH
ncbi:MAG: DUF29 domain-containing protein [Cyanobacteria bacterium P01_G01_bin.54]